MSRLHAGFPQTPAGGGPALTLPINTDWTIGSLPTGWSFNTGGTDSPVYSGTGTYINGTTDSVTWTADVANFSHNEMTIIIALNVTAFSFSVTDIDVQTENYLDASGLDTGSTGSYSGSGEPAYYGFLQGVTDFQPIDVAGFVIVANTLSSAGVRKLYVLDETNGTFVHSVSGAAAITENTVAVNVLQQNFTDEDGVGTAGNIRIANVYLDDSVLAQATIETLAASWGYVAP